MCLTGTLNLRNHLAVRDVLRRRDDLRDEYGVIRANLAADPDMDMDMDIATYIALKSEVLQGVLADSDLITPEERRQILPLNAPPPRQ